MRGPLRVGSSTEDFVTPEFITAGGIRIAFFAARRIAESEKRIGKDMRAIQRA